MLLTPHSLVLQDAVCRRSSRGLAGHTSEVEMPPDGWGSAFSGPGMFGLRADRPPIAAQGAVIRTARSAPTLYTICTQPLRHIDSR
jgi:hypothetical protein